MILVIYLVLILLVFTIFFVDEWKNNHCAICKRTLVITRLSGYEEKPVKVCENPNCKNYNNEIR